MGGKGERIERASKGGARDMTKWEYRIDKFGTYYEDDVTEQLNELGREGWELVAVVEVLYGHVACFLKRDAYRQQERGS